MRIPNAEHTSKPWAIARIAPDFTLLDVWALPVHGGHEDFPRFVEWMTSFDPRTSASPASRVLFRVRERLGALFGWDDATLRRPIPGCVETTLHARLPDHLRSSAAGSAGGGDASRPRRLADGGDASPTMAGGFVPLYRTEEEWAAEISNATVHGVLHLSWVEQDEGRYRGRLAIYVKPRGRLGTVYLKLIEPFRHLIVYPALTRQVGRAWEHGAPKEA